MKPGFDKSRQLVQQLQAVSLQRGYENNLLIKKLLRQLTASSSINPKDFPSYHNSLLSILAHPENNETHKLATEALDNLQKKVAAIFAGTNHRKKSMLTGSGIAGSIITGSFSYSIALWLTKNFPEETEIDSNSTDAETIRLFFRQIFPRTEYEIISAGRLPLLSRIKRMKGKKPGSALSWLLQHLDASGLPERTKEYLFHSLGIFVRWKINRLFYNNVSLQGIKRQIFYHKEIKRTAKIGDLVIKEIPPPKKLSADEREQLIAAACSTLIFLHRETEPFTYADGKEIACFELERGLSIVLYGMDPERRLSLESYAGYLALKNGIPVAYGGGWIFGTRCQFGINILPAFRGAESAILFGNLLRIFKQRFDIRCFAVKPYQFGKNNPEALQSGAFWFYYKHGFRPEDIRLQQIADEEWKKKTVDKNYHSPPGLLRKFTGSNLVLHLSKNSFPDFDAAKISIAITDYINKNYNGDRSIAKVDCLQKTKSALSIKDFSKWNSYEKKALQEWSFLSQACLDLASWNSRDKKKLASLIKAKGNGPELNFIKLLQSHQRLWKDLSIIF